MPLIQHYSSWKIRCGIADYTADLIGGLESHGVRNEVLPIGVTVNQNLSTHDMHQEYDLLASKAAAADLVHLQHEYSFFGRTSLELCGVLFADCLRKLIPTGKPIVITFHSDALPLSPEETEPAPVGMKNRIKAAIKKGLKKSYKRLRGQRPPETYIQLINKHRDQIRCVVHTRRTRLKYAQRGIASELISVVPMGFKPRSENIKVSRNEARRRLGLSEEIKLLSIFGFISKYKGPLVAAKALKLLPPNYALALVGGTHPATTEPILEKVLRLWHGQDPNRLIITGYASSEQVDLWQSATDFSLAPYLEIGMSGSAAITWALSSGKPVIASKTHTFQEISEDSGAMQMVTPNCPHELAWSIERLAKSPELADELVRKARAYSEAHTFDRTAEMFLSVYRQFPTFPATNPRPQLKVA